MAYTTKQEQEIAIARKRIAEKKGTPTDIANVKHFDSKRSLTGTLSGTRSLPQDDSQLTNMQSVMRMLKTESDKAQPSPLSKLQNFESITGIKPITTGAITGVIEMGEKERYAGIAERSRTLVDLIGEQEERKEKQRQDNLKWAETLFSSVENPFTVFSSDDIENMKLGIITPEMKGRAGKARTVELLPKKSGGGGTPEPGGFPKGFSSALKSGIASLQKGEQWGTVFDRIKMQFPSIKNEDLDRGLGVEWRKAGAFETFKQKQYKETQPRVFEAQSGIWKELAAHPEYDNETKKLWIQSQGFNPEDFNIY